MMPQVLILHVPLVIRKPYAQVFKNSGTPFKTARTVGNFCTPKLTNNRLNFALDHIYTSIPDTFIPHYEESYYSDNKPAVAHMVPPPAP